MELGDSSPVANGVTDPDASSRTTRSLVIDETYTRPSGPTATPYGAPIVAVEVIT